MARTEHNNTDPNGARRAERLAERDARMAHAEEVARMRAAEAGGDELDEMFAAHEVRDEFEAEAEAEAAASVADVEERAEAERAAEVAYHEARRAERAAARVIPDPPVYLVLGMGAAVRYASTNRRAAVAAAEAFADEDAARRPNDATPHYVVDVWRSGEREDRLHVYASRNGAPNPMSTATARELDEPDTGAYLRPEELAAEQTDNDDEVAERVARREAEVEWAARPAPRDVDRYLFPAREWVTIDTVPAGAEVVGSAMCPPDLAHERFTVLSVRPLGPTGDPDEDGLLHVTLSLAGDLREQLFAPADLVGYRPGV